MGPVGSEREGPLPLKKIVTGQFVRDNLQSWVNSIILTVPCYSICSSRLVMHGFKCTCRIIRSIKSIGGGGGGGWEQLEGGKKVGMPIFLTSFSLCLHKLWHSPPQSAVHQSKNSISMILHK